MLTRFLFGAVLYCSAASFVFGQQTTGALKGTVTDQLGSLVVGAKVTLRNARGVGTTANTNSAGVYEFRRLEAGKYELRIDSPGFSVFEDKSVEIKARELKTLDAQLEVALEDQQVTVDDRNISTDADNNQNAIVLRGRELEALPNDPQALASALQAMAGPTDPEAGGQAQIKVDGFSNGQIPPKEAIREVRINNNPFSAENEFPGLERHRDFHATGRRQVAWRSRFRLQRRESELAQSIHDKARSLSTTRLQLQSQWSNHSEARVVFSLFRTLRERCEFSCQCDHTRSGDVETVDGERVVRYSRRQQLRQCAV